MVLDYVGCLVVERVLKTFFADFKPKDIAIRRQDQLEREDKRRKEEEQKQVREKEEAKEKAERERIEGLEKKEREKIEALEKKHGIAAAGRR